MINSIVFDWFYTNECGEEYTKYEVGVDCTMIIEHLPQGNGDRCYYDICFENGDILRTFNPSSIIWKKEDAE